LAEELSPEVVIALVEAAAEQGYDYLAVSGGEPLMWHGLNSVLSAARRAGMTVTLTTNATLVTPQRAQDLAENTSYVAVSVDGSRGSHDSLRGKGTFTRMQQGVATLGHAGVKIGLIWTLTQQNAHELADVYAYACEIGALFVQVHPLEGVGYATQHLAADVPDSNELLVAGLFASTLLDDSHGSPPIYLDAASSKDLVREVVPDSNSDGPLSALVDPLVVRSDGLVMPGNYSLPEHWAIGCLRQAPLSMLARDWRKEGLPRWRALVSTALADLGGEERLVNFGAHLLTTASRG
jgi:MoaA/NifB/PqqE/SkfB family radical SAM enzyme